MTADFRLGWHLPSSPLGPAIRPEPEMTAAQRLRDERMEFEIQDFEAIVKDEIGYIVTEEDCRQIKGAAPAVASRAEPTQQTSTSAAAFPDRAAPPAIPQGGWVPKVGDRVRWTETNVGWSDCVVTGLADVSREDRRIPGALLTWGSAEGLIPFAELEPIDTTPTSTGWTQHDGRRSGQPVHDDVLVDVQFASGCVSKKDRAGLWCWDYIGPSGTIVAYRLAP